MFYICNLVSNNTFLFFLLQVSLLHQNCLIRIHIYSYCKYRLDAIRIHVRQHLFHLISVSGKQAIYNPVVIASLSLMKFPRFDRCNSDIIRRAGSRNCEASSHPTRALVANDYVIDLFSSRDYSPSAARRRRDVESRQVSFHFRFSDEPRAQPSSILFIFFVAHAESAFCRRRFLDLGILHDP